MHCSPACKGPKPERGFAPASRRRRLSWDEPRSGRAWRSHDIPDDKIRERYDRSRENLVRLLPALRELWIYDNSGDADPARGIAPAPLLVLHASDGRIIETCDVAEVPEWAKPLFVAAFRKYSL